MAPVLGFAICNLSGLTPAEFNPILPGGSWMGVNIVNGSAETITVATDPDNPATYYDILAGYSFMIQAVFGPTGGNGGAVRFVSGAPAFYLKPAATDGAGVCCIWA
jgi:hypothetical protein